jgi:hypothetical protein
MSTVSAGIRIRAREQRAEQDADRDREPDLPERRVDDQDREAAGEHEPRVEHRRTAVRSAIAAASRAVRPLAISSRTRARMRIA